jgi:hypothetical protein
MRAQKLHKYAVLAVEADDACCWAEPECVTLEERWEKSNPRNVDWLAWQGPAFGAGVGVG